MPVRSWEHHVINTWIAGGGIDLFGESLVGLKSLFWRAFSWEVSHRDSYSKKTGRGTYLFRSREKL